MLKTAIDTYEALCALAHALQGSNMESTAKTVRQLASDLRTAAFGMIDEACAAAYEPECDE